MESSLQMGNDFNGPRGVKIGGGKCLKLFGVRIMGDEDAGEEEEEVMRKSASMGNLASCTAGGPAAELGSIGGDDHHGGYLSDGGLAGPSGRRRAAQERKRGVPWTEEEHRTFLTGLQKLGKGDWRGISRSFVPTRTPTQVASHAQKYFLRQTNPSRKKRRSSLFDVVIDETDAANEIGKTLSSKEAHEAAKGTGHQSHQDNHLAGISSFNKIQAATQAEASQLLHRLASRAKAPPSDNLMANAISSSTKDHHIPSRVGAWISNPEQATPFRANFTTCVPEFLKLSLSHPHCPAESSAASSSSSSSMDNSDLELSIAPPRPHNLAKLSSQGVAGAISVV